MSVTERMSLVESLRALHTRRTDEVVVTAMGTAREWMELGAAPFDFVYVPSSMGQATSLGLGLALARPERRVVVCNGDGSTLMNLGSLVSISAQAAENLIILIFDNSVYEVTGAQGTPASAGCRADGSNLQFAEIARACGFRSVFEFNELEHWKQQIPAVLANPGPTLAVLHVAPVPNAVGPRSPGPARSRAQQFRAALDGTETSSDTC